MKKTKRIAWESWNSKEEEALLSSSLSSNVIEELEEEEEETTYPVLPSDFFIGSRVIHTPLGVYPQDSLLKPSDRWDCWIGYTNFEITVDVAEKIEAIEGIEVIKILGRYSFFIGIAKMFDIKDVRKDIENITCNYTEEEILSDEELRETVNLVKQQLQSVDYWSILVSPDGEVEYIASDKMDKAYLDSLNKLTLLKNKNGGIILRGTNG